mmetsp:Transcript_21328/g.50755  ORF Transcript_21328/g.50755 Transcript_21328/m.50755 type:complete len:203 (-) Transcript_21328:150-758(-)
MAHGQGVHRDRDLVDAVGHDLVLVRVDPELVVRAGLHLGLEAGFVVEDIVDELREAVVRSVAHRVDHADHQRRKISGGCDELPVVVPLGRVDLGGVLGGKVHTDIVHVDDGLVDGQHRSPRRGVPQVGPVVAGELDKPDAVPTPFLVVELAGPFLLGVPVPLLAGGSVHDVSDEERAGDALQQATAGTGFSRRRNLRRIVFL